MVCLTPSDAKHVLVNKTETIRWVRQAMALIDYYERTTGGDFSGSLGAK